MRILRSFLKHEKNTVPNATGGKGTPTMFVPPENLRPALEHILKLNGFFLKAKVRFILLFHLFVEDFSRIIEIVDENYSIAQNFMAYFKKSADDLRNFYYQCLQKMLALKFENNIV